MAVIIDTPWYVREDYPRILEIMEDADALPRTFDEAVKQSETRESALKAQGFVVVRVVIKPDEFAAWCRGLGQKLNSKARMRFCVEASIRDGRGEH